MIGDWGGGHWGMGLGWTFAVLFWTLIVVGLAALANWLFVAGGWSRPSSRPLDILKERYARGEITREQYEQMRRDIQS